MEHWMRQLPTIGVFAPRWQQKLEAFADDKRGIAAVEFALIAMPFFFLIFGLLEVCVIFIMSSILEHAASEASRQIRTGQIQTAGHADSATAKAAFLVDVCDELFGMMPCDNGKLKLDVQKFSSFGSTAGQSLTFDGASNDLDDSGFGFDTGAQNEIVVIRVFYEWDLIIPVMSAPLDNMGGTNRRLLQATVAFRNEPFGSS